MASEGSTTPLEYAEDTVRDEFTREPCGPFSHAGGAGMVALPASSNIPLPGILDRECVIDVVQFIVAIKPTAARTVRLAYVSNGQTMAAAVTALQFVTADYDLNGATINTLTTLTVDTAMNLIPAGSRLFLVTGATADTALSGLCLNIRSRTMIR